MLDSTCLVFYNKQFHENYHMVFVTLAEEVSDLAKLMWEKINESPRPSGWEAEYAAMGVRNPIDVICMFI